MSLLRKSNQKTFLDIFPTYDYFTSSLADFPFFSPDEITDDYKTKTYYLLVSRYGDTPVTGYSDEPRWKLRLFQVYAEYAPEWQTKSELQKTIRSMEISSFADAGKVVNNVALNPNTEPSTDSLDELTYINQQNVARKKLSESEAISRKRSMLEDGLDDEYLDHFKKLFSPFLLKDVPLWVYTDGGDDDE